MNNDIQAKVAADLGITNLPDAEQKQVISDFGAVALQASTIAVLEAMSEDKRAEFTELLKAGDTDAISNFLSTNLPDHESIARQAVAAEIQRFKDFQKGV